MIVAGEGVKGFYVAIFFGLCAIVFALQLAPRSTYLRLTADGFQTRSLFRQGPLVRWSDVSEFRVERLPPSMTQMVVYDEPGTPQTRLRRFNRLLAGGEAALLPDGCGVSAQDLAALMNQWRDRYSASGAAHGCQ